MKTKHEHTIIIGTSVTLLLITVFSMIHYRSFKEFSIAEKGYKSKQYLSAITHYERTIRWYTPLNTHIADAIHRLWETGKIMEKKGNRKTALIAYRSLRSSLYSIRSFYTPYNAWIEKCNGKISALIAAHHGTDDKKHSSTVKAEALASLKKDGAPHAGLSILLEISFIGWIWCAVKCILNGYKSDNTFTKHAALFWGLPCILFYILWITMLTAA